MRTIIHKKGAVALLCLSYFFLTSCSTPVPEKDQNGLAWKDSWIQVGTMMGVEEPQGLTLLDNKEALAADGLYYATWTDGDPHPYTNSDDEDVTLYDAQLYLLVGEAGTTDQAEINKENWLAAAHQNYLIYRETEQEFSGQTYQILYYNCNPNTSPYDHGISAFAVTNDNTICIELTCLKDYENDLEELMESFLDGCHYAAS